MGKTEIFKHVINRLFWEQEHTDSNAAVLKVWGRTEVEGTKRRSVQNTLRKQYQTLKKRVDDYEGYLAEVFMVQIVLGDCNRWYQSRNPHHMKLLLRNFDNLLHQRQLLVRITTGLELVIEFER